MGEQGSQDVNQGHGQMEGGRRCLQVHSSPILHYREQRKKNWVVLEVARPEIDSQADGKDRQGMDGIV